MSRHARHAVKLDEVLVNVVLEAAQLLSLTKDEQKGLAKVIYGAEPPDHVVAHIAVLGGGC